MKKFYITTIAFCIGLASFSQVSQVEPMFENRFGHTLTKIADGVAIAIGGSDGNNLRSSAEYYTFSLDQWEYTSEMNSVRIDHTADLIAPNTVIVVGGYDGETNLSQTEIYDFTTNAFTDGPALTTGVSYHKTALISDGTTNYLLVTGGFDGNGYTSLCTRLNLTTMLFEPADSMNYARGSHSCNVLNNGRVLVTGGYNPDFGFQMNQCEIYDPIANEWTEVAPLSQPRDNHAAVVLSNGDLIVTGGRFFNGTLNLFEGLSSCEKFSVQQNSWGDFDDTISGHSYHHLLLWDAEPNEDFLLIPGSTMQSGVDVETTFSTSEFFSSNDAVMNLTLNQSSPRFRYAACKLFHNCALATGGTSNMASTGDLYCTTSSVDFLQAAAPLIYPNPASNQLNIQSPSKEYINYQLHSADGRLVACGIFSNGSGPLEVGHFSEGVYHLRLSSEFVEYQSTVVIAN